MKIRMVKAKSKIKKELTVQNGVFQEREVTNFQITFNKLSKNKNQTSKHKILIKI